MDRVDVAEDMKKQAKWAALACLAHCSIYGATSTHILNPAHEKEFKEGKFCRLKTAQNGALWTLYHNLCMFVAKQTLAKDSKLLHTWGGCEEVSLLFPFWYLSGNTSFVSIWAVCSVCIHPIHTVEKCDLCRMHPMMRVGLSPNFLAKIPLMKEVQPDSIDLPCFMGL